MFYIPGAVQVDPTRLDVVAAPLNLAPEIIAYCRGPCHVYAHQPVARLRLVAWRLEGGLPEWRADEWRVASALA